MDVTAWPIDGEIRPNPVYPAALRVPSSGRLARSATTDAQQKGIKNYPDRA